MTTTIHTDDGVGLVVDRLGEGPPLLMVHGFTGAKEDFADHAPRFAEHREVVLFDHRGHGASENPPDVAAYSLDRLAADTLQVADALGLERFMLLGHSMGGMVARRLVLAHPERVDALVVMDTSLAGDVALTEGMTALRLLLDEANIHGSEADHRVRRERLGYVEFAARKWADVAPEAYAALSREMTRQPEQLELMRAITCPTLVIVGEQDATFLPGAHAMASTIPGARLVIVPDAGHSPQFENPDAYFDAVDGFLRATAGITA